ncbi:23S rRNA (guanine745-N1)-methyltransferase [Gracilibacillus orientalis]|uniref:23S rRNA (Guanine745-N1)-methyltransferase n=1 Tax=Gracilibacillus orientalis TaxID=334253 RepID=A0A1I4LRX2_9BACI|nr:methyltransferase domain-containing protein [Gracilibacillus orientalis]SFL93754.1 23S rRNA (guanine745-N1)-methyltransferase [Gracilibacillus orientalis]
MKKMEQAAQLIAQNNSLFCCPICHGEVRVEKTSVICTSQHQFDLAKKGYINFYTKSSPKDYDKQLFEARYQVIQSGMYDDVHQKIAEIIDKLDYPVANILDLGCGEGSHLQKITQQLNRSSTGIGMDIAKDGILTAAKYHQGLIWTVADLAQSPFQSEKFDILLNILSPANYQEFKRLLHTDGHLIKVVPRSNYLQEIREQVMEEKQQSYTNAEVLEHFKQHFDNLEIHTIQYQWKVPEDVLKDLWFMTPLTWRKEMEQPIERITIDLDIIIAQK